VVHVVERGVGVIDAAVHHGHGDAASGVSQEPGGASQVTAEDTAVAKDGLSVGQGAIAAIAGLDAGGGNVELGAPDGVEFHVADEIQRGQLVHGGQRHLDPSGGASQDLGVAELVENL